MIAAGTAARLATGDHYTCAEIGMRAYARLVCRTGTRAYNSEVDDPVLRAII